MGTKMETAMDMSIQPWMNTQGLDFPSEPWAALGAGFEPGGDIFWAPLESQENNWVAFIRNDCKGKIAGIQTLNRSEVFQEFKSSSS